MKKTFNFFTESYEIIRQTLRELFVYGCYDSSVGAERQKISDRKYSDELKRIRFFWSKYISARRHGEKKINFFPFNRCPDGENYLLRSYQIHSFKPQDLNLYIYLMQILSDGKIWSVNKLCVEVGLRCDFNDEIFYPMMSRKLEEMTAAGLLVRQGKSSYKLAEDILKNFNSEELLHLYKILFLYRELLPLSSLGYQTQQVLGDYLRITCGEDDLPSPCFYLEDIFYQNVLNDEILYKLTVAIEQQRRTAFLLPNRIVTNAIPRQIIFNCQYGRQYLRGESEGNNFFWRLDNISNVRLLEKFDVENFPDKNFCLHIWNASLPKNAESPCLVEIDFKVTDEEFHFLKRLEAEKRFGKVEVLDKNHWLFSIELTDPNELIPWIRSFGHVANVRASEQHNLQEKLNREWEETLENYFKSAQAFEFSALPQSQKFSPKDLPPSKVFQSEIFSEFRNAFYRAVIYAYNKILIDGKDFDRKSLMTYLGKISFDFDEKFSLRDSLIQEIVSCGDEIKKFVLFWEDNINTEILTPNYSTDADEEIIPLPPIRFLEVEKRWLRTFLEAPLARKLLGENLLEKLLGVLKDVPPFPFEKFLIKNGQRTDGDNFDDPRLAERILLLMEAIEKKIFIFYKQKANNGKEYSGLCLPTKIIYSPYLQKFQVRVAVLEENKPSLKLINVANFTLLEKSDRAEKFPKEIFAELEAQNFLKIRIFPIHNFNDIERCFLLFSTNRKEGYFDLKNNVYHLTIYYRNFEQRALRRKILSLGKAVVIDEPTYIRDEIINELKMLFKTDD